MRKQLLIFGFILGLLLVVVGLQAQTTPDRTGYILHLAESGTIAPLEDDTYLMMLTNTTDFNAVILTEPELFLFNYSLADFNADWEEASLTEPLMTTATLELNDFTLDIELTLAPSAYDMLNKTFSYEIRFVSELPESWVNKKGELLEEVTFERATLAIAVDETFIAGLRAGQEARLSGTRGADANPPFP